MIYKVFEPHDYRGRNVSFEYDPPFYKNMDDDLKSKYGDNLIDIIELNHRDKKIRMRSPNTKKGTLYIAPAPRKINRQELLLQVREILLEKPKQGDFIIELENEFGVRIHIILDEIKFFMYVFTKSTVSINGDVSGLRVTITYREKSLCAYLNELNFYPYKYKFLTF